jgi:hypothetical protein
MRSGMKKFAACRKNCRFLASLKPPALLPPFCLTLAIEDARGHGIQDDGAVPHGAAASGGGHQLLVVLVRRDAVRLLGAFGQVARLHNLDNQLAALVECVPLLRRSYRLRARNPRWRQRMYLDALHSAGLNVMNSFMHGRCNTWALMPTLLAGAGLLWPAMGLFGAAHVGKCAL